MTVHGTIWGYRRHLRDGEPTCDACRKAQSERVARYRRKGKRKHR